MQIRVTLVDASGRAVRTGELPSSDVEHTNYLRWDGHTYSFFRLVGANHVMFKRSDDTILTDLPEAWGEDVATEDS